MKNKVSEIKISYKEKVSTLNSPKITCSKDTAELLFKHWNKDTIELQETFKILLLNNSNKVKGIYELSTGSITGTLVDLRILFAVVLKSLSVGLVLSHNHPSHKLKPSHADIQITEKIKKAAEFFDIKVLDHLILAPNGEYYSFADNGDL
ncbi:JAB domain-containing protein [Seonamhaeicola aphaedonensis]|nr:JAB domain-containing protein [Seonamhaeicola aphaedonensis]